MEIIVTNATEGNEIVISQLQWRKLISLHFQDVYGISPPSIWEGYLYHPGTISKVMNACGFENKCFAQYLRCIPKNIIYNRSISCEHG